MPRLIDADKLKADFIGNRYGVQAIEYVIDQQPTIDAVSVIRCKDCALWNDTDSEHLVGYCTEGDGEKITFRNEWCCWAERRKDVDE